MPEPTTNELVRLLVPWTLAASSSCDVESVVTWDGTGFHLALMRDRLDPYLSTGQRFMVDLALSITGHPRRIDMSALGTLDHQCLKAMSTVFAALSRRVAPLDQGPPQDRQDRQDRHVVLTVTVNGNEIHGTATGGPTPGLERWCQRLLASLIDQAELFLHEPVEPAE